ncbi:TPA: aminopeptidase P family N-terminal domain-containing protein, partial [Streptococcus suis]
MSKLNHVTSYLETNKLDLAIFSDPVSIYYLTGYHSDPHERHMMLFVMPDHDPLL